MTPTLNHQQLAAAAGSYGPDRDLHRSAACHLIIALAGLATLIVIDAWVLCSVAARVWGVE